MRRSAFTLLEVMLVIALLAVLSATAMPMFTGQLAKRQLIESADQLRSLFYFASAEARQRGRRIEIRFTTPADTPLIEGGLSATVAEVRIERDPLGEPGVLDPLKVDWANWSVAGPKVQIVDVQVAEPMVLAPSGGAELNLGAGPEEEAWPAIIFSPAGRSSVGDVTVTLRNEKLDGYVVTLRGATGLAQIAPAEPLETEEQP